MVGREDHRPSELSHPFAPFRFGVGHHLGEREQKGVLDDPAQSADRLLPCPAEITGGRRHHRALLGPAVRPRGGPVPTSAPPRPVPGGTAHGSGPPAESTFTRVPGHQFILWFTLRVAPSATADGMSYAMKNESTTFFCQKAK